MAARQDQGGSWMQRDAGADQWSQWYAQLLGAIDERHAQHERAYNDRFTRVETAQVELVRRLTVAEAAIEAALDGHERHAATRRALDKDTDAMIKAVEDSLTQQLRALESKQDTRIDDSVASISIIMDMCETFATTDDLQSMLTTTSATQVGNAIELEGICEQLNRRVREVEQSLSQRAGQQHLVTKTNNEHTRLGGSRPDEEKLSEGVPPVQSDSSAETGTGAMQELQSQLNSLSSKFAEVLATLLHGQHGPAAQTQRIAATEDRVRLEQKQIKDELARLSEHIGLAPSQSGQAVSQTDSQFTAKTGSVIALLSTRVDGVEAAFREHILDSEVQEQMVALSAELAGLKRVQQGDSLSMRALRLLQKLTSRPDAGAVFAECDTNGDNQIDREELKRVFVKLGEEVTEQDIDCIMKLADTDGDGTIDISEFEQLSDRTKHEISMVETRIIGLLERYATQEQLKDMAAAVKKTLKSALATQAKRIAEVEAERSEIEDQQLQQALAEVWSHIEKTDEQLAGQVETVKSSLKRVKSESDQLRKRVQQLESRPPKLMTNLSYDSEESRGAMSASPGLGDERRSSPAASVGSSSHSLASPSSAQGERDSFVEAATESSRAAQFEDTAEEDGLDLDLDNFISGIGS